MPSGPFICTVAVGMPMVPHTTCRGPGQPRVSAAEQQLQLQKTTPPRQTGLTAMPCSARRLQCCGDGSALA
jgi:hypothetical protein